MVRAHADCARATEAIATEVAREAALNSLENFYTGRYNASWAGVRRARGAAAAVNTDDKARWLEKGTGVYGPTKQPIHAKPRTVHVPSRTRRLASGKRTRVKAYSFISRTMVFRPYDSFNAHPTAPTQSLGGYVYATEVKGQPGNHALHRAAVTVARTRGLRYVPTAFR